MLIYVNQVSPNDTIVTTKFQEGNIVSDVLLEEDGSVKVVYADGQVEWMPSNQIVYRREPVYNKEEL